MPQKEGVIKPYNTVEEIARKDTNKILFLDNNVLASDFGLSEMEKLASSEYIVDFNQGLDARLVTDEIANLLCKIKWLKYVRFSCDTRYMLDKVIGAGEKLRSKGYKRNIFVYVLGVEKEDTLYRLNELKKHKFIPFMQIYRDIEGNNEVDNLKEMKKIARWCNRTWIFYRCDYGDYKYKAV